MFKAEFGGGIGGVLRFQCIDGARHAGLHIAERAGTGAGVAENHHRGVFLGPAFANVRAGCFFAHGVKFEAAHEVARFAERGAHRGFYANPVGLAHTGNWNRSRER